jgi:hypothetical protein
VRAPTGLSTNALGIAPRDIFESYFRRDRPFDKKDSKEFPDAFVVMALDRWCEREHQKMYVVTNDKAMLRAVEQTKTLIAAPTLEDYLALRVENPKIVKKVERILESSAWTMSRRSCETRSASSERYTREVSTTARSSIMRPATARWSWSIST